MSDEIISWTNKYQLIGALNKRKSLSAIKEVVKKNTAEMEQKEKELMRRTGPVYVKGYSEGNNQRNTNLAIKDDGMTGEVKTETDHITYIEFGTRFMDAEPAVKPAFDMQKKKFIKDLENIK